MNILKKIRDWVKWLFSLLLTQNQKKETVPPVVFAKIDVFEKPPRNEEIIEHRLYFVLSANKPKWSLFKCPCGCGDVITLSLQAEHKPHWRLLKSKFARPTLHPSIWRNKGCLSHFWLKDGRVYWCRDTGSFPASNKTITLS